MRFDPVEPPREFEVGRRGEHLCHVGDVHLEAGEVVTFHADGTELDITRKEWGYYLTPSLNQRLAEHGLRAALCIGVPREDDEPPRVYMLGVQAGREAAFEAYLEGEEMRVLAWLDTDASVLDAANRLSA